MPEAAEARRYGEDFLRFVAPGAERLVALAGMLAARGLPYSVLRTGEARHVAVRIGSDAPSLILMAHYDRVDGSPGVLDNSCACLELADFAHRMSRRSGGGPSLLVVFSDLEEAPATQGPENQGAHALALAIRRSEAAGAAPPPVLVLDVTGRGDRLLVSRSALDLLARSGPASARAAASQEGLLGLCGRAASRAGLAAPLLLPLPWSDDLGLSLGGLGSLTLSLLPADEAHALAEGLAGGPAEAAPDAQPATWGCLHGPEDRLSMAEPRSFALMASFLDALALELCPDPPSP